MAFRTLIISTHCKLEYSLEYLVYRGVDVTKRIFLNEISTILIESTQVSITTSLINEIVKRKIKVIFCDERHDPIGEIRPYNNSHNSSERILIQIEWDKDTKDIIWKEIIKEKIKTESLMLRKYGALDASDQLANYLLNVENGDITNREGHAAKVYFKNIFYDGILEKEDTSFLYISNSFSLSLNSKKNLNALYKILKNRYYLEFKNDFIQINNKLEEIIKEISIDFDINLNANAEVKLDDLFKIASIEFSEDYTSYFEKLIKFIKISNELEKIDVVFIKNMHSYLNDDEIIQLINEFKYLNIMIINIEFAQYFKSSDFEVNYIIDKDLCEIY